MLADRTDDEWTALNRTFGDGATRSRKVLAESLATVGVSTEGLSYREVQKLFIRVREEICYRASAVLNRVMGETFRKMFIQTGGR